MRHGWLLGILLGAACAGDPHAPRPPAPPPDAAPLPVPDAAAPTPATPAPEPVAAGAHPTVLGAIDPDGRWMMLCQAREDTDENGSIQVTFDPHGRPQGDALTPFFLIGTVETEIDSWVAAGPTGRWVAYVRDERLLLHDVVGGGVTDLSERGVDLRDDRSEYRGHRSLGFGHRGKKAVYLRRKTRVHTVAVVRDLETGTEVIADPGTVDLWRAELDPGGHFLHLYVIGDDTNGNGRLDWPTPPRKQPRGCRGSPPSRSAWLDRGDELVRRIARVDSGAVSSRPGLVGALGRHWVLRKSSGALELELEAGRGRARRREIAPAACEGRVVEADPTRESLLATCTANGGRSPALWVDGSRTVELPFDLAPPSVDWLVPRHPRYLPVYPGREALIFDFETRRIHALEPGDAVIAISGTRALFRRARTLWIHNLETGHRTRLPGQTAALPRTLRVGETPTRNRPEMDVTTVLVDPWVVSVASGKILGQAPPGALAVRQDGAVLVADRGPAPDAPAVGPLEWQRVTPSNPPNDAGAAVPATSR